MSGAANPLHSIIDKCDERTWRARQRINPSARRQCMELICEAREAALHGDVERVLHLCSCVEEKVRDARMWRIADWLNDNAWNHQRIAAWFLTMKRIEEERLAFEAERREELEDYRP